MSGFLLEIHRKGEAFHATCGSKEEEFGRDRGAQGFGTGHFNGFTSVQRSQRRRGANPVHLRLSGECQRSVFHHHTGKRFFFASRSRELHPNDGAQTFKRAFPAFLAGRDATGRNDTAHRQFVARIGRYRLRHGKRNLAGSNAISVGRIIGIGLVGANFKRGRLRLKARSAIDVARRFSAYRHIDQNCVGIVPGNGTAGEIDGSLGISVLCRHGKTGQETSAIPDGTLAKSFFVLFLFAACAYQCKR